MYAALLNDELSPKTIAVEDVVKIVYDLRQRQTEISIAQTKLNAEKRKYAPIIKKWHKLSQSIQRHNDKIRPPFKHDINRDLDNLINDE